MQAIGGLFELWIVATAGAAVLYFTLAPVVRWLFKGRA